MNLYENIKDSINENIKDNLKESDDRSNAAYIEEQIPHNMRYKVCNTIKSDDARKTTLYWVTQDFFTKEDLNKFVEALQNVAYDDAYITVRDLSVYDFNTDLKNGVLIHIRNGVPGSVEGFDKYWEEGKNYFDEEPMNESESTGLKNFGELSLKEVANLNLYDGDTLTYQIKYLTTDDILDIAKNLDKADGIFKYNNCIILYCKEAHGLHGRPFTDFRDSVANGDYDN